MQINKISLKIALISAVVLFFLYLLISYTFSFKEVPLPEKKNERYYQIKMCNKLEGKIEYRLADKTRVDCLTDEYAIEVDWAKKWAEGIGQSLYYGMVTNKKPAIGLIVEEGDERYLKRLYRVSKELDIKVIILER